jgi:coatomer protein complex subunit gamma
MDKAAVLQEARSAFHESPLHPIKCRKILSKLLYLLCQQTEPFNTNEATETFFSVTKLFQSPDVR